MRLLDAIDRMDAVLDDEDAPAHHLLGVRAWRREVASAVSAGHVFAKPRGMTVTGDRLAFLCGRSTHRAWVGLCGGIIKALRAQQLHGQAILDSLPKAASLASEHAIVAHQAAAARAWMSAATTAALSGVILVADVDALYRPVGEAIARAGGIGQVARVKTYHQRWL